MQKQIVSIIHPSMQDINLAGGKGASLSRLSEAAEFNVPQGYIVTTQAYRNIVLPAVQPFLQRLEKTAPEDLAALSIEIQDAVKNLNLPSDFNSELDTALSEMGYDTPLAVRSSATAEDLPDASFAGQQDSYLNVRGLESLKTAVLSCFASLYNERAIAYRIKNGFDENDVSMAVVLQRMVPSEVSGVMFTADPMSSDRYTVVIESVEGLGEELVSGRKTPATYRIKDSEILREGIPSLSDTQIKVLAQTGKKIEKLYEQPQDIEWCFADGQFHIVQSRPITTLFPAPESTDGFNRCFMSFAHMQMMTDVVLPLGVSFANMISNVPLAEAGGRLYIDITHDISNFYGRKMVFQKAANLDPLMDSALKEVVGRKSYLKSIPKGKNSFGSASFLIPILKNAFRIIRRGTSADIEAYLLKQRKSLDEIRSKLEPLRGYAALDLIEKDQKVLYNDVVFDPVGFGMIMAVQFVQGAINKAGEDLLGEKNIINALSLSVDYNVTSEMGLALGEIADMIRRNPKAIESIERDLSINSLKNIEGGNEIICAWDVFIEKYGMRCPGEIDITKPRFWEDSSQLIPSLINNVKFLEDNHAKRLFEQGRKQSLELADKLVKAMNSKHGRRKARKLEHKIKIFRTFLGVREYPKYFWIARYEIYKRSLLRETEKLANAGTIEQAGDAYYLYFDELRQAVQNGKADKDLINARRKAYEAYKTLTPPRVIFSDGEVPSGKYNSLVPEGALAGLGVSNGIVEGRARVVSSMEDAHIEKGDILVTKFTDPSWTPAFVSIAGLVTEVGGMMTHGAVITREYGLPAVVGVVNAMRLIRDGQRIRINGNDGYVEILQ